MTELNSKLGHPDFTGKWIHKGTWIPEEFSMYVLRTQPHRRDDSKSLIEGVGHDYLGIWVFSGELVDQKSISYVKTYNDIAHRRSRVYEKILCEGQFDPKVQRFMGRFTVIGTKISDKLWITPSSPQLRLLEEPVSLDTVTH
jgi:hypothetical protein